jgi:hypothetical protein
MSTPAQLERTGVSLNELIPARFTEVWFIDTEFIALDGEPNLPVSNQPGGRVRKSWNGAVLHVSCMGLPA